MFDDKKNRFREAKFRKKLRSAREFKRPVRRLPKNFRENVQSKLGIYSWKAKFLYIFIFAFLVYILYIPNFLFIKYIEVEGLNVQQSEKTISDTKKFFSENKLNFQKNLIFLNKRKLSEFLKKENFKILRIKSLDKKFPNKIILNIEPRTEKYLLTVKDSNFVVSNDGVIIKKIGANENKEGSLIPISLKQGDKLYEKQKIFEENLLNRIEILHTEVPKILNSGIKEFNFKTLQQREFTLTTLNKKNIIFDINFEPKKSLEQLKLITKEIKKKQIRNLSYIDMRFKNKGFVCFKNTACDVKINNATTTPTTTIETTINK